MAVGAISLEAVRREWSGAVDPWIPPVFVARDLVPIADDGQLPRLIACSDDGEALARAAGCAWARRCSGAAVTVDAVVSAVPDRRRLARLTAIAGPWLRISVLSDRAPDELPPGGRWCRPPSFGRNEGGDATVAVDCPAVRLRQVELARAASFAEVPPRETPVLDAREGLRYLARLEDALVLPLGEPPWQALDVIALQALAQVAAEGYRPVALADDAGALIAAMPGIARAGLPLVVVAALDAASLAVCCGVDGWWIAEAADRPGLHALLASALLDRSPWLIRLPAAWCHDLPPSDDCHEPGAGRVIAGEPGGRVLVCTTGGIARARAVHRAAAAVGVDLAVVQAASLRPFPWQAVAASHCAILDHPDGGVLAASAACERIPVEALDPATAPAAVAARWRQP